MLNFAKSPPRMASSEFRKSYATLEATTEVTVNGHLIGTWIPASLGPRVMVDVTKVTDVVTVPKGAAVFTQNAPRGSGGGGFGQSRPAPKPGRK